MSADLLSRLRAALADRYAVESEIGRGGMATVYLAEDLKHHRKVAIKVLHPELAASVGTDRFLREIETVAGLTHPHVLPLHDSGEADRLLYFVMPYVKGENLRQRLEREKQLPVDEATRLAWEVAGALDHAHREGVVHRDIKPANILLEEEHAVVADFGVARAVSAAGGESVTATGMAVGTPAYMSPEQAAGEEVDERSDLYALGCILYEMLAGEPPLVGPTPQATAAQRLANTPTPLGAIRTTVPANLASLVERALAPTAADRPATARELAEELEEVRRSPGPATQRRSTVRWLMPAVGVAVITGVALVSLLTTDRSAPREARLLPVAGDLGNQSVAVLPFTSNTGVDTLDGLRTVLPAMLTTDLGQLEGISVVSWGQVAALLRQTGHDENEPVPEDLAVNVAAASGARTMLVGSLARLGGDLRLDVQLVDVADGTIIYAHSARGPEVMPLADEVTRGLVSHLGGQPVTPTELTPFSQLATSSLAAYREYEAGLLAQQRFLSNDAIKHFQAATDLDSTFALAWLRLGIAALGRRNDRLAIPAIHRAQEYSANAPERDRMLISALSASISRESDSYLEALEEMIARYPDDTEARFLLGVDYRDRNRPDDARRVQEAVLSGDPTYIPALNELIYLAAAAGDESTADSLSLRFIQLEPDQGAPYDARGDVLEKFGRVEEAREMFREAIQRDFPNGYINLYDSYTVVGDPVGARAALEPFRDRLCCSVLARMLESDSYGSEGRYLDALEALRSALETANELDIPQKHMPLAEVGAYAHYTGAYDEAEDSFLELIRNDWRREFSLLQLLAIYGKQQRYDEMSRVRDAVAQALDSTPDALRQRAESHLYYADALVAWYRDRDAVMTVRRFAEGRAAAARPRPRYIDGMEQGEEVLALIELGQSGQALQLLEGFERMVEIGVMPFVVAHYAWYLRGRAYESLDEPERALASYQQLLDVAGERVSEIVLFRDTPERVAALQAALATQP